MVFEGKARDLLGLICGDSGTFIEIWKQLSALGKFYTSCGISRGSYNLKRTFLENIHSRHHNPGDSESKAHYKSVEGSLISSGTTFIKEKSSYRFGHGEISMPN